MLLAVLQLAVLAEAVKILGPGLLEELATTIYNKSLSSFLLLMITCVTGHGGWQRWSGNGPRPVADQLWEQCAPSNSALSSLLFTGKLWCESH